MNFENREIDILCVGEALIDFIGQEPGASIENTREFHKFLGGSPTNVAVNSSRLGLKTALIATVGNDGFGTYILKSLDEEKVQTKYLKMDLKTRTSVIFVSRTDGTPDFVPFRGADFQIEESQIAKRTLLNSKVFHTTCFALSREPARTTILKKAEEAFEAGCQMSIDVNYARKLWDSREVALKAIKSYCRFDPLVKISEDDVNRLFKRSVSHQKVFDFFAQAGVSTVCLTLGSRGVKLAVRGKEEIYKKALKVDKIQDATGAGDAFWSGFLYAYITKNSLEKSVEVGQHLAALKLQSIGRLPENIKIVTELL
jgi:fructokinase